MGKKVKRTSYTSKGQRPNVSAAALKLAKQGVSEFDRMLAKIAAWKAGKNPWITVAGPSSKERFVRVRANTVYGDPKRRSIFPKMEEA